MHADNPALAAMINNELLSEDVEAVKRQTEHMAEYFRSIAAASTTFEVRRLAKGLPHFQLIVTEQTVLVLQYVLARYCG